MSSDIRIIGDALSNIPWEERLAGCEEPNVVFSCGLLADQPPEN